MHGQFGEYLPPKGYHRKVNPYWFEDNYGEFVNSHNQYCYIQGECVADLPLGEVYIELTKGYEITPLRTHFTVTPETDEITFELARVLNWRERGWVTADTHVHFLSPQTALLEGSAEGVNVVNLLASQWGEMFSNVSDFDGKTTIGAKDFGGNGGILGAGGDRKPYAGFGPHLFAGLFRADDPSPLHGRPLRIGHWRSTRGEHGRVGSALR